MKQLFLLLLILAILVGMTYGIGYYLHHNPEDKNFLTLYGNVDIRQVDLGFRVQGRVEVMPFEEGDLVLQGALMAILDKQPYVDQVRQAEARVESARTSLANSEQLLRRRQPLMQKGAVSKEDLEVTQTSRNVNSANLKEAIAALSAAVTNLEDTKIFAPAEGIILTRIREPGTVVLASEPIYTLSLTSPVWIRAYITGPYLGDIYPGMPAKIYTDRHEGPVYTGHVGFISPVAEFTPKTVETTQLRTDLVYRLRIIVGNPDKGLRQGMPVTIKLYLNPSNQPVP